MMFYFVIASLLGGATLFACSNNKESESEKGKIETMTDKAAKELVNKIRTPMDRAREVEKKQLDRYRDMEETLKEQ
jgi:hypothetical protein